MPSIVYVGLNLIVFHDSYSLRRISPLLPHFYLFFFYLLSFTTPFHALISFVLLSLSFSFVFLNVL